MISMLKKASAWLVIIGILDFGTSCSIAELYVNLLVCRLLTPVLLLGIYASAHPEGCNTCNTCDE